ncbi:MAG: tryptophan synthase subunit alpha [Candidatus Brocadiae bacterium]|nr:tryptophan synthase subunit alpha [Candidatus Brocadiia bacterium]
MNRIDARFQQLREARQAAFIPFFTAGDPDLDVSLRIMRAAEDAGADLIELGFPFSDPVADGPTIQASYARALAGGQRVADVLDLVRRARDGCALPIVAMVSYSIVFKLGFENFLDRALDAGLDGATIPDLPVEEAAELFGPADERDFRLVCFVTPATTSSRVAMAVKHARGFIYYISVRGITGERSALPSDLAEQIQQLKAATSVPVAVGFGVSTPEQAAGVAMTADGVIVGSAIVKRMAQAAQEGKDAADAALSFIRQLGVAVKDPR